MIPVDQALPIVLAEAEKAAKHVLEEVDIEVCE